MSDIEGFILAGGASSRMGTDKARLVLDGKSFVERIAESMVSITNLLSIVSARPADAQLGLPRIADIHTGCGALGGLHAALTHARASWALVVSCDLPFVTGQLLARLASLRGDATDAVAPVQADGRMQPLCALYARETCLGVAEELLRAGELRPRVLLKRVRARLVGFAELSDLDGAELFFVNVNTPGDFAQAREHAKNLRATNAD